MPGVRPSPDVQVRRERHVRALELAQLGGRGGLRGGVVGVVVGGLLPFFHLSPLLSLSIYLSHSLFSALSFLKKAMTAIPRSIFASAPSLYYF